MTSTNQVIFHNHALMCKPREVSNTISQRSPGIVQRSLKASVLLSHGSSGSFASKNNEATDGLNSATIGDIRVINSIGKYPNSVEQRMRKPSFVVTAMWSSLEVTRAFRSAGIPYRKTRRAAFRKFVVV